MQGSQNSAWCIVRSQYMWAIIVLLFSLPSFPLCFQIFLKKYNNLARIDEAEK